MRTKRPQTAQDNLGQGDLFGGMAPTAPVRAEPVPARAERLAPVPAPVAEGAAAEEQKPSQEPPVSLNAESGASASKESVAQEEPPRSAQLPDSPQPSPAAPKESVAHGQTSRSGELQGALEPSPVAPKESVAHGQTSRSGELPGTLEPSPAAPKEPVAQGQTFRSGELPGTLEPSLAAPKESVAEGEQPRSAESEARELGTASAKPSVGQGEDSRSAVVTSAPPADSPPSASAVPSPPTALRPSSSGSAAEPNRPAQTKAPALHPLSAALGARGRRPLAEEPAEIAQPVATKPARAVLSVGELTRQIKSTLERNFVRVCVRGEVSGFRGANPRGHLYFCIKDAEATLDVKIWASSAQRMKFKLRDGLSVIVEGSIDLYEPSGKYSLIVQRIEPVGEGALALAFAQLKERLAEEGLIGEKRKRAPRPLPRLPRRIGVVTSITGAALRDFLRIVERRHPRMSVLIADARVQGEGAASEVVRALNALARTNVDVIVVTRGGGSVEDLWTFNEEVVARAIHASPIPVVSAIGHEVDFTIADFVADLRAPTPSAAAEIVVPVLSELQTHLRTNALRLRKAMERQMLADRQRLHRATARLSDPRRILGQKRLHLSEQTERMLRKVRAGLVARRQELKALQERLGRQRPEAKLQRRRAELKKLSERLQAAIREALRRRQAGLSKLRIGVERASPKERLAREHRRLTELLARAQTSQRQHLSTARTQFHNFSGRLEAMSPLKVMARGYGVAFRQVDGHVIRRSDEVTVGDSITLRLASSGCDSLEACDSIDATVTGVRPGKSGSSES